MLLLYVALVFSVPVVGCLSLLALFIQFGLDKPVSMSIVEIEEEPELDLDKIVKDLLANEVRRPLYRSWTKAGYSTESGK